MSVMPHAEPRCANIVERSVELAIEARPAVAGFLRVSLSMIYKLRRAGSLPAVRVGALFRFEPDAVRAFARGEPALRHSDVRLTIHTYGHLDDRDVREGIRRAFGGPPTVADQVPPEGLKPEYPRPRTAGGLRTPPPSDPAAGHLAQLYQRARAPRR
jgi:excisionase family DNA binding protein